ncbi:MAG: DNA mismatch repair endonuclease MutL [Legionellales bacterium]
MDMRIHQLPPAVANQIAAGEVIERPASVVKELLENSLDAGADAITIEIGYGGLNQVKISDNGAGIVAEDLPLALMAHATSKITKLDDLYAIDTMGFRGEALASIASVAKVTVSSKPANQEHAMMLRAQGGEVTVAPCARSVGTTIDVVDIFFNAPVRKRFLKTEKLEFQAIEAVVKRFALSAPHIAILLKHNGIVTLSLPAAVNEQLQLTRMNKLFGSAFIKDAVFLDVARAGMRLYGWASGPNFQRSQNDRQWVYINQRMVKDKLINHALKQAYDGLLHPGRFPACLLYLTINSSEVDVNVHPTKHEVRFQQPRLIHDFFTSQLTEALSALEATKPTDAYEAEPYPPPAIGNNLCEPVVWPNSYHSAPASVSSTGLRSVSRVTVPATYSNDRLDIRPEEFQKSRNGYKMDALIDMPWVILNRRHVLVSSQQHFYLVNVVKLQQRWLRQQLAQSTLPLASRPLLVPIGFSLAANVLNQVLQLQQFLEQLGIRVASSEQNKVIVCSVPTQVPYLDIRLFLESIVTAENNELSALLDVLSAAQTFEPRLLAVEERNALNEMLSSQTEALVQQRVCKPLTEDDCRMFLHE